MHPESTGWNNKVSLYRKEGVAGVDKVKEEPNLNIGDHDVVVNKCEGIIRLDVRWGNVWAFIAFDEKTSNEKLAKGFRSLADSIEGLIK